MPRLIWLGVAAWLLQPLYIVLEVVVGLRASADYSFADSTISDLGITACRSVRGDLLCSPSHAWMNAGFIWFGCTLALGALLLGRRILPGRLGTASVALWCVAGAGSIGVGLVPVNENGALHGAVALPIFVAQPLAILLLGWSLRTMHRRVWLTSIVVAAISAAGALGFLAIIALDGTSAIGTFERLALWPGYLWVSAVALKWVRRGSLRIAP